MWICTRTRVRAVLALGLVLVLWLALGPETRNRKWSPIPSSSPESVPNPPSFRYLQRPPDCPPGRPVPLVALVHSAPNHGPLRRLLRKTWARTTPRVRLVFLLGDVEPGSARTALEEEARRYRDVVRGDFIDSYRNLTYKHLMGLTWASERCPEARLLLKMDDDIFVHYFRLKSVIERLPQDDHLSCYVHRKMAVVRHPGSKWYVSEREYPDSHFPDFCSGWAYLLGPSAARRLVRASRLFPYFWVDDVHVTGTLARAAGLKLHPLDSLYALDADSLARWARSPDRRDWNYVFGPTLGDPDLTLRAHLKALRCGMEGCRRGPEPGQWATVAARGRAERVDMGRDIRPGKVVSSFSSL
ncbi:beta-1,3-galactosyltransferase 5-like [Centruroides vittatus]|uniref:beta-1,3-galactosyltransferase 5-like n=1 Tax=Centruroides vittatus TaxID=120091 RepID=UPI0035107FD6